MKKESEYIEEFKKKLLELKPIIMFEKEEQENIHRQEIRPQAEKSNTE